MSYIPQHSIDQLSGMLWRFPANDELISGVAGECSWCHCGLAQAGLTRVRLVSLMPGSGLRDHAALRGSSGAGLPLELPLALLVAW